MEGLISSQAGCRSPIDGHLAFAAAAPVRREQCGFVTRYDILRLSEDIENKVESGDDTIWPVVR